MKQIRRDLKQKEQELLDYQKKINQYEKQQRTHQERQKKMGNTSFRLMDINQKRVEIIPENIKEKWHEEQVTPGPCKINEKYNTTQMFTAQQLPKYMYYPPSCTGYDITYCKSNNSLYVFGGVSCTSELSEGIQHYFYIYQKQQWREVKPKSMYLPMPRYGHTLTCIGKELFLFGGVSQYKEKLRDRCFYADLWSYNVTSNNWRILQMTGEAMKNRKSHAACVYNKFFIIHGGVDDSQEVIPQICWASMQQKKIRTRSKRMEGRFNHKIQICHNSQGRDYMFIFGGRNKDSEIINQFLVYPIYMHENQLIIRQPTRISQNVTPRQNPIMCPINNGIIIMGGIGKDNETKSDSWFYDVQKQCLSTIKLDLDWEELRGAKGVCTYSKQIYILQGSTSKKYKAINIKSD